jgi:hypothetical protein
VSPTLDVPEGEAHRHGARPARVRAPGRSTQPRAVRYDSIAMMTGDDVTMILERLDGARVDVWLDGG